jgi:hypothetical protein
MFWPHWNLSALRSFYGLAASGSQTVLSEKRINHATDTLPKIPQSSIKEERFILKIVSCFYCYYYYYHDLE